jgi:hypothetical protein
MGIAKWSMRVCAVLFLLIAAAAAVVIFVPSVNEWIAENSVEATNTNPGGITANYVPTGGETTPDDVKSVGWVLVATFVPMAALFWWMGRWFASMQPSLASLVQGAAGMGANPLAGYQSMAPQAGWPVTGTGTAAPPPPTAPPPPAAPPPPPPPAAPTVDPADPTAGGIIS